MPFVSLLNKLPLQEQRVIAEIRELFKEESKATEDFAKATGLMCKKGCGQCCTKPDVHTTLTEMLPLAVHLWATGKAEEVLDQLETSNSPSCFFYEPHDHIPGNGRCAQYEFRPGICRLFGFSARRNKYGHSETVLCQVMKDRFPQQCSEAQARIDQGLPAVHLSDHTFKVLSIDPVHGQKLMPINKAARLAIERVGLLLSHQE